MSANVTRTTCPLDCPDTCALEVTVTDGRVTAITGSSDYPLTDGYICSKVRRFPRRLYHPERLQRPLRRSGPKGSDQFNAITWDEAIESITQQFRSIADIWGAEAILPYHYGGSNGMISDGLIDTEYFARLGASRLAKTICAAPTTAVADGMYGLMPGVAFEDYVHARCIVIWGANPKASNIHLVPLLREAKRRGAFIATVDPHRNFSARESDLHLSVYPGADLPLALGMIRYWSESGHLDRDFLNNHATGVDVLLDAAAGWPLDRAAEGAGVSADDIRRLADVYASASPAVIRCGWGLERNRNGGQAVAAVLAMPALLGKFGVRGGGYTMSNSPSIQVDASRLFRATAWTSRVINMTQLARVLGNGLEPPIKGLFVYNCNPAVTVPEQNAVLQALAQDDLFTVVFDQVMTDTARYADIVLPATTFLEHFDIRRSYGHYVVGGVRPVIEPVGEARSNAAVFAALGRAMGWEEEPFTWDDRKAVTKLAAALEVPGGAPAASDMLEGRTHAFGFEGANPVQGRTVHPRTPDGKIHLAPPALGESPFSYDPVVEARYPLALISPAGSRLVSSVFGEFNLAEMVVIMHPRDAARRRVAHGDVVRVFNGRGEVHCRAAVSDRLRPGVVSLPKGAWRRASRNGQTATALCPATVGVVGDGACFNDARVEVEPLGPLT